MSRTSRRICFVVAGVALFSCLKSVDAQNTVDRQLATFVKEHCFDCHSGDSVEGNLNLASYASDLTDAEVRRRWVFLYDRVAQGEMPPESAEQPSAASRANFLKGRGERLARADLDQREVVLRRLNRTEYTNTVRDLFDIYVDVSRTLTDDSTESGFDNIGSTLSVSAEQLELYVEAADMVLDQVFGPSRPHRELRDAAARGR
jgi:hypothetical protein